MHARGSKMQTCSLKEGPASKRCLRFWRHCFIFFSFFGMHITLASFSLRIPSAMFHNTYAVNSPHSHSLTHKRARIRAYLSYFSLERKFKKKLIQRRLFVASFIEILKCTHKNIISRMNILRLIQLIKNTSSERSAPSKQCSRTLTYLSFSTTQNNA